MPILDVFLYGVRVLIVKTAVVGEFPLKMFQPHVSHVFVVDELLWILLPWNRQMVFAVDYFYGLFHGFHCDLVFL